MDYHTLPGANTPQQEPEHVLINSLYAAFQGLADPRKRKGKR